MPQAKSNKLAKKIKPDQKKQAKNKELKTKEKDIPIGTSVNVFDINGKSQGVISLPKEFFGQKPNEKLIAQALRVYTQNQHSHTASTKTRAEKRGGGAKPWRQKGTGRARAGSKRSPLWVGGGVTFGPKPTAKKLNLPKKMKRKALVGALSKKRTSGEIKVISNFNKLEPKTKIVSNLFRKLEISGSILLILEENKKNVNQATRNIPKVSIETVENLNTLKIVTSNNLLFSKEAIGKLQK